jgi:Gamma tubulin complex component C-terminal
MLEYTHGEIGWDVFTLEYKADAPIDTVLDPDSMTKYLRLFNHLWKMKRIEGALSKGWLRVARGARSFLRVPGKDVILLHPGFMSEAWIHSRTRTRLASDPHCHGGDGSLHSIDASLLSSGSHRMLLESSNRVPNQEGG